LWETHYHAKYKHPSLNCYRLDKRKSRFIPSRDKEIPLFSTAFRQTLEAHQASSPMVAGVYFPKGKVTGT
jgi:hypothetical protein